MKSTGIFSTADLGHSLSVSILSFPLECLGSSYTHYSEIEVLSSGFHVFVNIFACFCASFVCMFRLKVWSVLLKQFFPDLTLLSNFTHVLRIA